MTKAAIHSVHFDQILIDDDRQRKEFKGEAIVDLANSIAKLGLIHAVVLRRDEEDRLILVAGERRIKAMQQIWAFGQGVRHAGVEFPLNEIPFVFVGDIDPVDAFEMELEENIRREDISWQERAKATAKLFTMRKEREATTGLETGFGCTPLSLDKFTKDVHEEGLVQGKREDIRADVVLAAHLDVPEVYAAKTQKEAMKALRRVEQTRQSEKLAAQIGTSFAQSAHTLLHGDSRELLVKLPDASFDVVLSDPPYGMGADSFQDGAGKVPTGGHFYEDSYEYWKAIMDDVLPEIDRLTKPEAHMYLFCDIDRFEELRTYVMVHGWRPHRTPFIWHNPSSNRVPWPQQGPMRKWQMILYAVKGTKPCTSIQPDLITCPSDTNLGHPAQKPVPLLVDLLKRSTLAGDSVLDPFAGSGSIFPAAHSLKVRATGIEQDTAAYGLAAKRLGELT